MAADGNGWHRRAAHPRIVVGGRRVVAATVLAHAREYGGRGHGRSDNAVAVQVEVCRESVEGRDIIVGGGIIARIQEVLARPRRVHGVGFSRGGRCARRCWAVGGSFP